MNQRHALGRRGETFAEEYFCARGATVLARNYRIDTGELDLVLRHEGDLVAVEVKTRNELDPEAPEEAVRSWKLRRIVRALTAYAAEADLLEVPWRIDLLAIETDVDEQVQRVEHIPNIFPP